MKNKHLPPGLTEFVEVLPGSEVTNAQLPEPFEDIEKTAGVNTRYLPAARDTFVTVSQQAIRTLFEQMNITGDDCAGLVVATSDIVDQRHFDEDVRHIAALHGMKKKPSIAVHAACSGFTMAVQKALEMPNPEGKHVVIATGDTVNFLDWHDRKSCSPFGAGGSATTLIPGGNLSVLYAHADMMSDPEKSITLSRRLALDVYGNWRSDRWVMNMFGKNLLKVVPPVFMADMKTALATAGKTFDELTAIIPHRASAPIIDILKSHLGREGISVPVIDKLRHGGNAGSSTIPITLARMQQEEPLHGLYAMPAAGAATHFAKEQLSHGVVLIDAQ